MSLHRLTVESTCFFNLCCYLFLTESRLPAPERLRCNLQADDEIADAKERGLEFPRNTLEHIEEALEALSQETEQMEVGEGA